MRIPETIIERAAELCRKMCDLHGQDVLMTNDGRIITFEQFLRMYLNTWRHVF